MDKQQIWIQQSSSTNWICGVWDHNPSMEERLKGLRKYFGNDSEPMDIVAVSTYLINTTVNSVVFRALEPGEYRRD